MTDQPDRPDGDGLLQAPGTILQIGGASPGNGWGSNAIEVRESTGGVGWRWRAITAVENQWLIDALNSKVAPPIRGGAKGAVSRDAIVLLKYAVECLQETMTGKTSKIQAAISNINLAKNALRDAIPPKPAPAPAPDHKARANAYSLEKWGVELENLPSDMVDGCYDATFEATDVSRS